MKKYIGILLSCVIWCTSPVFAQAPISDPTLLANFIKQVGKDTKQLQTAIDELKNSTVTLVSLGMIGSLDEFADPLYSLGTNDISPEAAKSVSGDSATGATSSSGGEAASAVGTDSTASATGGKTTFPSAVQVRSGVEENLQLSDDDTELKSEKVAAVRQNLPKTKAAIATYGVALSWVNRTIATRNIADAKTGTQQKADETQDNRKAITSNTSSNTNIAETYNRLLMSGAATNALSAINTMEQAGNLH